MNLYHYTSIESWEGIQNWSFISKNIPGLWAIRRLWREYQEANTRTAVFLLLDSEPTSWTSNQHFPDIWERLKRNTWELLLEIKPKDINKYSVLDWWYIEWYLCRNSEYLRGNWANIPLRYLRESREEAEKAYIASEIPLKQYLESKSLQDSYSIPEIITSEIIPLSEISISKKQPKLLDKKWIPLDNYIRKQISEIPGLKKFLKK